MKGSTFRNYVVRNIDFTNGLSKFPIAFIIKKLRSCFLLLCSYFKPFSPNLHVHDVSKLEPSFDLTVTAQASLTLGSFSFI